jgi:ABC-2 type transport system ATP-binding protein
LRGLDAGRAAAGTFGWIPALGCPSVAAVRGHAYGAGLQLALACDFRIFAEGTKVGLLETRYGLLPDMGATVRLPRIVGESRARELILLGDIIDADAKGIRSIIGLASQYATVDEMLTGRENLELVGLLYHLDKAVYRRRAADALERMSLAAAGDRPVGTYSGGMRRRLDLAASLIGRPPVLFLDEPTTGLDPRTRNDLWQLIEELVAGGTTVLLTTQYMDEAEHLAGKVVDRGCVLARQPQPCLLH